MHLLLVRVQTQQRNNISMPNIEYLWFKLLAFPKVLPATLTYNYLTIRNASWFSSQGQIHIFCLCNQHQWNWNLKKIKVLASCKMCGFVYSAKQDLFIEHLTLCCLALRNAFFCYWTWLELTAFSCFKSSKQKKQRYA